MAITHATRPAVRDEAVHVIVADRRADRAHHRHAEAADRAAPRRRPRRQRDRDALPGEEAGGPLRRRGRAARGPRPRADDDVGAGGGVTSSSRRKSFFGAVTRQASLISEATMFQSRPVSSRTPIHPAPPTYGGR